MRAILQISEVPPLNPYTSTSQMQITKVSQEEETHDSFMTATAECSRVQMFCSKSTQEVQVQGSLLTSIRLPRSSGANMQRAMYRNHLDHLGKEPLES